MTQKRKHLIFGLILDAIGYASYAFPVFGEGIDIIWAPLSAYIMIKMYEGTIGKVGGAISLIEEGLPFTDFVPTYTLMWVYRYILKKDSSLSDTSSDSTTNDETIIDI